MEKTKEKIWADWLATQSSNFQELLDAATEDEKYKILAQLLVMDLEKSKNGPQH
jgi:hypothetical protein